MPHVRALSFAYNADVYANRVKTVAGVRGNAQTLLARLRDSREDDNDQRPIVFVAHSLGGIILKQVCLAWRFWKDNAAEKRHRRCPWPSMMRDIKTYSPQPGAWSVLLPLP